jgi:hypothetical protein
MRVCGLGVRSEYFELMPLHAAGFERERPWTLSLLHALLRDGIKCLFDVIGNVDTVDKVTVLAGTEFAQFTAETIATIERAITQNYFQPERFLVTSLCTVWV